MVRCWRAVQTQIAVTDDEAMNLLHATGNRSFGSALPYRPDGPSLVTLAVIQILR